jgi:hypothetical protein
MYGGATSTPVIGVIAFASIFYELFLGECVFRPDLTARAVMK